MAVVSRVQVTDLSVADAEQDYRVAMADASDAYDAAICKAAADRLKAEGMARARLDGARQRDRDAQAFRREMAAHYAAMYDVGELARLHDRYVYMAGKGYAPARDQKSLPGIRLHVELLAAELARRDLAVT